MIFCFSAHPDDTEIGCGGYIYGHKHEETNHYIYADCGDYNVTDEEVACAQKTLQFDFYREFNLTNRELFKHSREIRESMEFVRDTYDPDIVFLPCRKDMHQDHITIREEGMKIFKKTTILGYIQPWNTYDIEPNYFYRIDDNTLDKKIEALQCYQSQSVKLYMENEKVKGWASFNGWKIGVKYAEGYEVIRMVV